MFSPSLKSLIAWKALLDENAVDAEITSPDEDDDEEFDDNDTAHAFASIESFHADYQALLGSPRPAASPEVFNREPSPTRSFSPEQYPPPPGADPHPDILEYPGPYPHRGAYGDSYRGFSPLREPLPVPTDPDIWHSGAYNETRTSRRREPIENEIIVRREERQRPRDPYLEEDIISERSYEDEYRRPQLRRDPVTVRRPEILNWIGENSKLTTITRDAAVGAGEVAGDLLTALARKLEGQPELNSNTRVVEINYRRDRERVRPRYDSRSTSYDSRRTRQRSRSPIVRSRSPRIRVSERARERERDYTRSEDLAYAREGLEPERAQPGRFIPNLYDADKYYDPAIRRPSIDVIEPPRSPPRRRVAERDLGVSRTFDDRFSRTVDDPDKAFDDYYSRAFDNTGRRIGLEEDIPPPASILDFNRDFISPPIRPSRRDPDSDLYRDTDPEAAYNMPYARNGPTRKETADSEQDGAPSVSGYPASKPWDKETTREEGAPHIGKQAEPDLTDRQGKSRSVSRGRTRTRSPREKQNGVEMSSTNEQRDRISDDATAIDHEQSGSPFTTKMEKDLKSPTNGLLNTLNMSDSSSQQLQLLLLLKKLQENPELEKLLTTNYPMRPSNPKPSSHQERGPYKERPSNLEQPLRNGQNSKTEQPPKAEKAPKHNQTSKSEQQPKAELPPNQERPSHHRQSPTREQSLNRDARLLSRQIPELMRQLEHDRSRPKRYGAGGDPDFNVLVQEYARRHYNHDQKPFGRPPERRNSKITRPRAAEETVDWRTQLCRLAGAPLDAPDHALLKSLRHVEETLRHTNDKPKPSKQNVTSTVLHRISCGADKQNRTSYVDEPYFINQDLGDNHLRARKAVFNLELHIEKNRGLSFIIFKDYSCCNGDKKMRQSEEAPTSSGESIYIISPELCSTLRSISAKSTWTQLYPEFRVLREIPRPYLWFYHDRKFIEAHGKTFKDRHREHLQLLLKHIKEHMGAEYAQVDEQLKKGVISSDFLEYLFTPNEILIAKQKEKGIAFDRAHKQILWPKRTQMSNATTKEPTDRKSANSQVVILTIKVQCWEFDGVFQKKFSNITVTHSAPAGEAIPIQDLDLYPIRFEEGSRASLIERGQKFWDYRQRKYISYEGWDFNREEKCHLVRFMIDITTYRKMHPDAAIFDLQLNDELGEEAMKKDEAPAEEFLLLLPPNVYGFNMQEKKWMNLLVANTSEVPWNIKSFETLVVDEETKELIKALVTNKIDAAKSTDLMAGKGNGLIVLLHGGPGTGKTLTGESVAEYAKKPLYRVTCGDIGTNPQDVEKYLTIVLYLGKIWDCVVLLDEAEVFLQERNMKDLQRNALVSVFLRVLEYYDGILILTSNRVATFDEAFKSRIQLALHYERLSQHQRKKIWENFINRLKGFEPEKGHAIDTDDLLNHLDELSKDDLNGRQIRNAVTTARQLAMFKKTPVDYAALRHVINVSSKFDKYLKTVNEGLSDEDLAKEYRIR